MLDDKIFKDFLRELVILMQKQGYQEQNILSALSQTLIKTYNEHPEMLPEGITNEIKQWTNTRKEKKPIVNIHAHKAKSIKIETSKIGKKLRQKKAVPVLFDKDGGEITTGHYKKREVHAIVNLSYDKEELKKRGFDIPALEYFTPFELDALTHAISMYSAGNEYASMAQIWRQMNGGQDKELTQAMKTRLIKAYDLLGCTRITINSTEEAEAGYNTRRRYSGVLLPNEILEEEIITINGEQCTDCIHFFRNSPLYDYSEDKDQIGNIDVAMLSIPNINGTEQNILLAHYLARFYAEERNGHRNKKRGKKDNSSYIMLYSTIYEYLDVDTSNRTITARIRAATRAILNEWVKKCFIKNFQELTENNTPPKPREKVAKIKIELFQNGEVAVIT